LACFYSLLVLSSSLYLAAEKYITRLVVVLILLFLLYLNDWKLIFGNNIGSSNRVINIFKFLVSLGVSDTMFVTSRKFGIIDAVVPR
jgi:hypothetical protein